MKPRFSIIIPAYNEEKLLPRLLESITIAAIRYDRASVEIIVADNLSTDLTQKVGESWGARVVSVAKRRIAAARNGGAAKATGEILCFIDADSAIHPDTFFKIEEAMLDDGVIAGASGIYLERWSLGLLLTYLMMLPFIWITGMDTGIVFCRRTDFEAVGGYNENLYYAEDVAFLYALKQLGKKTGQGLVRLSGVQALGSTRKFDEKGDWHYFPIMTKAFSLLIKNGMSIFLRQENMSEFTDYWYRPPR